MLNATFHPEAAALLAATSMAHIRWESGGDLSASGVDRSGMGGDARNGDGSASRAMGSDGVGFAAETRVPLGLLDTELRAALRHLETAPLVRIEHADAPIFGGFASEEEGLAFEEEIRKWVIPGDSRFSGSW